METFSLNYIIIIDKISVWTIKQKSTEPRRVGEITLLAIDVDAFYRKYAPMVLRRCRKILQNEEEALQAMQETFVKVLENEKRLKNTYPSSLLYRIATNICLNIIRSYDNKKRLDFTTKNMENGDFLVNVASNEDVEKDVIHKNILETIFQKEKESTAAIAVMFYMDGMTLEEIAKETMMSVSGVRKRLRSLKTNVKKWTENRK